MMVEDDIEKLLNFLDEDDIEIRNYSEFYDLITRARIKLTQLKLDHNYVREVINNLK